MWIILVLIYIVSVFLHWLYVKISHSKNGVWELLEPTGMDFIIGFIPIINTLAVLIQYVSYWPTGELNFNKFFNIK